MITITKEKFMRYEKVRQSGKYNMITDFILAKQEANLTEKEYFEIIKNYSNYKEKYKEV